MVEPTDLHDWSDAALLVQPARTTVAVAWLLLVVTGVVLAVGGFGSLRRLVKAWPVRPRRAAAAAREEWPVEIRAAIRGACAYYPTRTWCLQKSATLACLLRWRGVPAEVVIGVNKLPFHAHAWVEADRVVVNGPSTLKTRMLVIERW